MTDTDDKTMAKTLWSDTLVDILIAALKKNAADDQIKGIIRELREKGFKKNYVIGKVTRELDENAARRVRILLGN